MQELQTFKMVQFMARRVYINTKVYFSTLIYHGVSRVF